MIIHQIFNYNDLRNFTYVLQSESHNKCIVIDPFDADKIINFLEKKSLTVQAIVNTHEHHDHICGNDLLRKKYQCSILAHKNAEEKIPNVEGLLEYDDLVELSEEEYLKVLDTPGHTFAHLCLLAYKADGPFAVFTGDTLFNAGVGNCHHGGDPQVLYQTISRQLNTLENDILVYPGHDYLKRNLEFTLEVEKENCKAKALHKVASKNFDKKFLVTDMRIEREINTFLRLEEVSIKNSIAKKIKTKDPESLNQEQVFIELRKLRDNW